MQTLRIAVALALMLGLPSLGFAGELAPVMINCSAATAIPGGEALLEVTMQRDDAAMVAGTQNDLVYDDAIFAINPEVDCTINPDIGPDSAVGKQLFGSNPPEESPRARVLIVALDNDNVIPAGQLYTCRAHVAEDTPFGDYSIENTNIIASSAGGTRLPVNGQNCSVSVVTPTPTVECTDNDDCPPGEVCVDNHCVVATPTPTPIGYCEDNDDCPPGQVCVDNMCITVTPSVTPTPIGYCEDNDDCPPGQVCVDNMCVTVTPTPRCREDSDCPSGQVCIDGECVDATPTSTPTITPTATPTQKRKKGGGGCSCEIDPNTPSSHAGDVLAVLLPALVLLLRWRRRPAR